MIQYKCNSSDYIVYIDYTSSSKYISYNKLENHGRQEDETTFRKIIKDVR